MSVIVVTYVLSVSVCIFIHVQTCRGEEMFKLCVSHISNLFLLENLHDSYFPNGYFHPP